MEKSIENNIFGLRALLKSAIPSYLFPLLSTVIPGYVLKNPELVQAGYTTIALPALLATILCFGLLWMFQKKQVFIYSKYVIALVLCMIMVIIAMVIISVFNLHHALWNIIPSILIGAVIIAMTKPLQRT